VAVIAPEQAIVLDPSLAAIALAAGLAFISIGGALYEFLVVDPAWPNRPELIQPERGGVSRKRFWIPDHTAFELTLIAALVMTWAQPSVRVWLLVGLASHAATRIWSLFDFIPKGPRLRAGRSRDHHRGLRPPLDAAEPLAPAAELDNRRGDARGLRHRPGAVRFSVKTAMLTPSPEAIVASSGHRVLRMQRGWPLLARLSDEISAPLDATRVGDSLAGANETFFPLSAI
jgi:hypothetical protein